MFLLYNFLLTLFAPIWVPWMLWRTWKRKEQPNWQERTGNLPLERSKTEARIWFHAVSVGEVIAAKPILTELKKLLPDHKIILSVTTSSGRQTAREMSPPLYDTLIYFPIDVARFQLIAMQKVQPKAIVIMETELWMNFLWAAKVFDATTLLVNGRISDKHFPRTLKAAHFYRALFKNVDQALMQSDVDANRVTQLGAKNVRVLGNTKFDEALGGRDANPAEWRTRLKLPKDAVVVVVGSTRGETEEAFVMDAIAPIWDEKLWVIHAPRHIESCENLLKQAQARFQTAVSFSSGETGRYVVVDQYGVLAQLYAIADVAIIGGGFEKIGGQNLIQPLAQGIPVLHGPYMQNFREATAMADRAGAAIRCETVEELSEQLKRLLADPKERKEMGSKAKKLVEENLGAGKRYAIAIRDAIKDADASKGALKRSK